MKKSNIEDYLIIVMMVFIFMGFMTLAIYPSAIETYYNFIQMLLNS